MATAHRLSRRWLLVAAGATALAGVGVVPAVLPADAAGKATPEQLRDRVLGSAAQPWTGYALSSGRIGLPELPQLEGVTALFTGTTRIRAFVAGPDRWRVDELTPAGERDTYRRGGTEAVWDFGANQLTVVEGDTPVRLPRAADLLPPDLARRLVGLSRDDPVSALPARRVADRSAAGFRVSPTDPATTVDRLDVWADPVTGLALRVEVAGRTDPGVPVLVTELRDVTLGPPAGSVLTPRVPPGAGVVHSSAADVSGALRVLDAPAPPSRLADRDRVQAAEELPGVGLYGSGLAVFALVPLSGRIAGQALDGATGAGATPVAVPAGRAVALGTPLVSVVVRAGGRRGSLLVGTVVPAVLAQAAAQLSMRSAG